jgi:hypothetical protein
MENVLAYILMAAISLPVSYFVARGCLRGVVHMLGGGMTSRGMRRDVL